MSKIEKYTKFGFGPRSKNPEYFYETLLFLLDPDNCRDVINDSVDSCRTAINAIYTEFKEWCRDIYSEMKKEPDKAYFFFKDVHQIYLLRRNDLFSENEGKIFYKIQTNRDGDNFHQLALIEYEYFNLAIDCLQEYINKLQSVSEVKPRKEESATFSRSKKVGFNVKNQDCLVDAFNQLVNLLMISKATEYEDFESAFLGQLPRNKIKWLKGPGLLKYFIKGIDGIGIKALKKSIWDTTVNCFQDEKGLEFEKKHLRHGNPPKNTEDIEDIENVVETLNEGNTQE